MSSDRIEAKDEEVFYSEDGDEKERDDGEFDSDDVEYEDDDAVKRHPSYNQVMLDVDRCAGRLEHMKQTYLHRTDDDEQPEDLTDAFELQRLGEQSEARDAEDSPANSSNTSREHESDLDDNSREGPSLRDSRVVQDLQNQRELKAKLAKLIVRLLIKKPDLHYYQGFHDVCLTYMTLLGDRDAYKRLDKLIDSHFNIFMQPTMNETQDFLALIPLIVGLHDSKVQEFLEHAEVGTIFSLSWVITWFSHVIPNQQDVEKIFEFLENQDPHLVLYLSAGIVIHKRKQLLELEPEMSTVHHFLCQVPRKEKLPVGRLLDEAFAAYMRWSPEVVKRKLDSQRKARLQVHNTNIIRDMAHSMGPLVANYISGSARTAIIVFVIASALALQYDRWFR